MIVNTVQPDSCTLACFYLVCHLETEQQFLVCSLGHQAAEVIRPVTIQSLHFESLENVIWKWTWTEELDQEGEQHFLGWFSCTLGSLEIITSVPLWKWYTDSLSSVHIRILRVLRNSVIKKPLYCSVSQLIWPHKTIYFLVTPINTSQDTSFPQNRVGEKQEQLFFSFVPIEAII